MERDLKISPITLEGKHVRLEPMTAAHEAALVAAADDGEIWRSTVTIVPSRETMRGYIETALRAQSLGMELPFVIVRKSTARVVGTTRFYDINFTDGRAAIGYTWLGTGAQRTPVNTESKLLLLIHAFEQWKLIRIELITDVLNQQSRAAILRLGAKEEGIRRSHMMMPDGRIRDSACFSIISAEWPDVKAALLNKLAGR